MKNFVVLDLDGTILDTLEGITKAVNKALKFYNYDYEYDRATVKTFIGNGARRLFLLATKQKEFNIELEKQYVKFCEFYEEEQYVSKPYKGVKETLKKLNDLNIGIIVYSNKPNFLLQNVMKSCFPEINFLALQGQVEEYPVKPDVTLLNKILKEHKLYNINGLYVGDSYVDNLTAMNAQMDFLFCNYGYAKDGDNLKILGSEISNFSEILDFLK